MSKYKPWKELEKFIRRELEYLGFEAKRLWDIQFGDGSGLDVVAKRDEIKLAIQCKYGKRPNFKRAWIEANTSKKTGDIPMAVVRLKEERSTLVVLSWSDFKKFIK